MKNRFVVVLFLLFTFSAFSQQYNFINYSVEQGLIQSQINALCQDDKGYIWIGTLGGVSKFDGINFKNYSTKNGLINNQVNTIFKDQTNKIWLGSLGGVSIFDGNKFENLVFKSELSSFFVTSITQDKNGVIWLSTDGGGIVKYHNKKFEYITIPSNNNNESNYVRHIFCDSNDRKWLSTKNGVYILDVKNNLKDTISNINASQVHIDKLGIIWCSTFGDGVIKITKNGNRKFTNEIDGLISNHIRAFYAKEDGSIWFVSKSGISKLQNNIFTNFSEKDGLTAPNIKSIIEDSEGNMFMGSDGGGLIKFTNDKFVSYTQNDGLNSNIIMSIIEDQNGAIWFSTYGNGVCKMQDNKFTFYTESDGLGNNTVWCSLLGRKNRIWFGTSTGFSVFDGKKLKSYDSKHGLNANKVYALAQDENENIWIGSKEGLSVLYLTKDSLYNFSNESNLPTNIRSIFIENAATIWLCSSEGLVKFNPQTKQNIKYTIDNGLPDNSVMTLVKDENDRMWVGTKNGLAYFNKKKFISVPVAEDYPSNNINFLKIDKFNSLWIGTNNGLFHLKNLDVNAISSSSFTRYSNLDGLKSLECNQNAVFIDSKNNLWFGTNSGLTKHYIKVENKTIQLPTVNLKEIRLFFEPQDWKKYTKEFDQNQLPKNLVLPYNKNHLTFDFDGIYHKSPDKLRFRFRLNGFDENWQPVTKATFVTYSNIPFGEYTFELSGSIDMIHWSESVKFNVTIKPPFWFTWWFYLAVLLALAGFTWLIIELRIKAIKRKQATQLIVDQAKMLSLEQQALNASLNRHFIFNALNSIQYYINRQDKLSANKYLTSFAKLVRKNLDSTLENEIELDDEIERIELYLKLEQMRFQDKFEFNIDIDESLRFSSVKIPSMLLQPYIENSIWHGILPTNKHGEIIVRIVVEDGYLIITIKDNGIGIETSLQQKKDKKQLHVSKGMELTKSRINLINRITDKSCFVKGPYQIYDADKKVAGTEVSITIKMGD